MTSPDVAPVRTRGSRVWMVTAASSLGIGSPGYIHHGLAAIGPFLIAAFALSKSSYGFLIASFSLVGAAMSPALGSAADRVGGLRLLRWAFWLGVGVAIGMALAPGLVVLVAVTMLAGLTASAANPATNTLIGSHVPTDYQGMTVGIKQAGGPLGIAAAGAVMPVIAESFGWQWAVASGAVIPLVGLGLLRLSGVKPRATRPRRDAADTRTPLGFQIRILTVNAAAIGWGVGAILGFIAVFGVEEVGMAKATAGLMLSVIGLVGGAARLGWGMLADRTHHSHALLAAMGVLGAVGTLGVWASAEAGPWLLVAATAILGVSVMAWNAIGMLAVIRDASADRAGAASGVVVFGFLAGFALGPWVFGTLVDLTDGYSASFVMVTAVFLASAAVLTIRPSSERGVA